MKMFKLFSLITLFIGSYGLTAPVKAGDLHDMLTAITVIWCFKNQYNLIKHSEAPRRDRYAIIYGCTALYILKKISESISNEICIA